MCSVFLYSACSPFFYVRKRRVGGMRFLLIPIGNRGDVLRERTVMAVAQAEGLYLYTDILLKTDAVLQMPAVKAQFAWRIACIQISQRHAQIRAGIRLLVVPAFIGIERREAERTAEIIFRAIIGHTWLIGIPIQIEFDFAFAPPVRLQGRPCEIGTDVAAAAFDAIQNRVDRMAAAGDGVTVLCMEIRGVFADWVQLV